MRASVSCAIGSWAKSRAEPRRPREPEQVREHRARVPVQVTVAALAVLPGRPPEDAAEDEHGAGTRRLGRERRPHVLLPQPAQRVLERMELVEALGEGYID